MSLPRRVLLLVLLAACCGCGPLASTSPVAYQLNAVSLQTNAGATPSQKVDSPLQFVGRNSCSATACHGQPQAEPVSWRNAYRVWETADPHRRAFDVLYTERSVQMFRKLTETTAATIDDLAYLRFVEEKCIGCHATPPTGSFVTAKLVNQTRPDAYWQGVSCESCHGSASSWLGQHYSLAWPETGDPLRPQRTAATGFHDTRSLDQRAKACVKCHQGPQQLGEQLYDVNHDLIAAGHPRLQFELHAYLANLPKHWDEDAEIARYEKAKPQRSSAQSFHFDTWRAGRIQQSQQTQLLQQARAKLAADNPVGEWTEFASKDCRLCHHTIGDVAFRLPFTEQTLVSNAELWRQPTSSVADRAKIVQQLLSRNHTSDQAIDSYLAAAALAHDLPRGTLAAELTQLHQSLAKQSGASQYDLPGRFDPQQPELKRALNSLQQALQQLRQ
jgi:hypothetical protein